MPVNPDFKNLLELLNDEKAKYLIVGAYAVIYYTEPRYTKDIDIWVEPSLENAKKVWTALKKFGAPIKGLSVDDLQNKDLIYQLGIEPNRVDIIMQISGLNFASAWKNKKSISFDGELISLLSLDDLKKAKKAAGRAQDILDLEKLKKIK